MSLLSVVKDVCAFVGVTVPTTVFGGIGGNRTMQEMLALANEVTRRISYDTREWTRLKLPCVFVGDDVTTAWPLPANYKRMLLTSNVWSSMQSQTPMLFIPDTDQWMQRRAAGRTDGRGEWTLLGGAMHIYPPLPVGATASFAYLAKDIIALNGGGLGDAFQNDADVFVLDERLLKLGMVWQWKAHKGSPYAEDMGSFSDALVIAMGNDQPSPIIIGRGGLYNVEATPWP